MHFSSVKQHPCSTSSSLLPPDSKESLAATCQILTVNCCNYCFYSVRCHNVQYVISSSCLPRDEVVPDIKIVLTLNTWNVFRYANTVINDNRLSRFSQGYYTGYTFLFGLFVLAVGRHVSLD